jgi:hypothetical protein
MSPEHEQVRAAVLALARTIPVNDAELYTLDAILSIFIEQAEAASD